MATKMTKAEQRAERERLTELEHKAEQLCQRCGHERQDHARLLTVERDGTWSNGVLICPTALFNEPER